MGLLKYDTAFMARASKAEGRPVPWPDDRFIFGGTPSANPFMRILRSLMAGIYGRAASLLLLLLGAVFRLARVIDPNFAIGRLVFVTRHDDACAVLADHDVFAVPYTPEMIELAGGTNSILGIDGPLHDALGTLIAEAMRNVGTGTSLSMTQLIERQSAQTANALLDNAGGRIDVMTDLITRTLTETTCTYFGFTVANPVEFAHWTMTFSRLLFADPTGSKAIRSEALNAAPRLHLVIDQAIVAAKAAASAGASPVGLIRALVDIQIRQSKVPTTVHLTDARIRATVIGLIVALIPTNTLAAGKMLEELMRARRAPQFREAVRLARAGSSDDALKQMLLEAGRLNPALSPGLWRYVKREATIAADQHAYRRRRVFPNDLVLVAVPSALRDRHWVDDPHAFDANRAGNPSRLMFGHGAHFCIGDQLAMVQLTQIFKALFARDPRSASRRAKAKTVGPFPVGLDMDYRPRRAPSAMIIIAAPAARRRDRTYRETMELVDAAIGKLGNPAGKPQAASLHATDCVHFASLSVVEANADHSKPPIILFEINADGALDDVLQAVVDTSFEWLAPIFGHVTDRVRHDRRLLLEILRLHAQELKTSPFDPLGLNFDGMRQFSVRDIERQSRLALFARQALDRHFKSALGSRGRALDALAFVRNAVRANDELRPDLFLPSRRILEIAAWRAPRSFTGPFFTNVWRTPAMLAAFGLLFIIWFVLGSTLADVTAIFADAARNESFWNRFLAARWTDFAVVLGSLLALVGLVALALLIFVALLAWHEQSDKSIDRQTDLARAADIARMENQPGQTQNHIIAVMPMKRGWFRRLTLALSLWGIKQSLFWFRPGFVVTMGTIHYAKWFVVPGTDQFVFMANYDGSWESYLEDFITRAHEGQSAAWSNGLGFPMTRWLIRYGAEDGDRFKRWVRNQQRLTPFWYCRFPDLTTAQIRKNALIQEGLVRATTSTEARAWLSSFGSEQRQETEIEADEVQSLVFSGQPHSLFMTCILVAVPRVPAARALWLGGLTGQSLPPALRDDLSSLEWREQFKIWTLPMHMRIAFGDHHSPGGATFLALTESGLEKLGLPRGDDANGRTGLASFPPAFRLGMATRPHILGDRGSGDPQAWRWADAAHDGAPQRHRVDAALLVYGAVDAAETGARRDKQRRGTRRAFNDARERHRQAVADQLAFLARFGGSLVEKIETGPDLDAWKACYDAAVPAEPPGRRRASPIEREHFGFRDGVSQPAIRGTVKASMRPATRDIVAPGEFILGYRNNQDYFPPAFIVRAADDLQNKLPTIAANAPLRFPHFGSYAAESSDADTAVATNARDNRDFGRNGTFLVIRDLEQDVDGFRSFTQRQADAIQRDYPHLPNVIGRAVDPDWVAAKMIGRWQDGSPLVGNAHQPPRLRNDEPENDFSYGIDDPRGLQCPLGAHIRRCNPRDSLEPGDPLEQLITNRHRLIRRGRSYVGGGASGMNGTARGDSKGLLFACICADLERQFEFVQQSWINAAGFHGLSNETDPVIGAVNASDVVKGPQDPWQATFTIPTSSGAVTLKSMQSYVTVRAGGYFFLPSRSALLFLESRAVAIGERWVVGD